MKTKFPFLLLAVGVLLGSMMLPSSAAVLTDPTLHNGASPQAIDPSGRIRLWPNNERRTRAQLYAMPGFGVVQDFVGFTDGTNTLAFTDPNRADLRISFDRGASGFSGNDSGSALNNAGWATSGASAVRWTSKGGIAEANTMTATLRFGSYDGVDFNTTNSPAVTAVGFTLSSHQERYDSLDSVVVSYYSVSGSLLLSQTIDSFAPGGDPAPTSYALFFSYEATEGQSIGSIVINANIKALADRNHHQIIFGIDDIGYTSAIPEASHVTMAFVAVSLAAAFGLRRRRARAGK